MWVALGASCVARGILPKIGCWKWWMGLEKPRSRFSDTPLFALVKLELSVFCKNYALACHRSIFRPQWRKQKLFRFKNYPRKLSRLSPDRLYRIKNYFRKLSWLSRLVIWSCQERPKKCCISGDRELGPGPWVAQEVTKKLTKANPFTDSITSLDFSTNVEKRNRMPLQ